MQYEDHIRTRRNGRRTYTIIFVLCAALASLMIQSQSYFAHGLIAAFTTITRNSRHRCIRGSKVCRRQAPVPSVGMYRAATRLQKHELAEVVVAQNDPFHGAAVKPFKSPPSSVADGEVLVQVVKFVMTGNTLTYATMGKLPGIATWSHYPHEDSTYARSPAWGIGVVTTSRSEHAAVGTRVFGYFPMSPWVIMKASKGFTDMDFGDSISYRAPLVPLYRHYVNLDKIGVKQEKEDMFIAEGFLHAVGWGIAQEAKLNQGAGRRNALLLTSAGSRTAITAAFSAKHESMGFEVIGLTSKKNEAYVRATGLYDTVCTYDEVSSLAKGLVAVYDMAGNANVQEELRAHYGKDVVAFNIVGSTHVNANSIEDLSASFSSLKKAIPFPVSAILEQSQNLLGMTPLPSLLPSLLNSPSISYINPYVSWLAHGGATPGIWIAVSPFIQAAREYGTDKMMEKMLESQNAYLKWKEPNFKAEHYYGADAVLELWQRSVAGETNPQTTHICSTWPESMAEPSM